MGVRSDVDRVPVKDPPSAVAARQDRIVQWLAAEGRVDVISLAVRLGVAQETVRRDLRTLESEGLLQRVHGGAVPLESAPLPTAPAAAPLRPDDIALTTMLWTTLPRTGTILLGTGPLTLALVAAMAADPPPSGPRGSGGLTVVSNSLDAAIAAARIPNVSVYNIGGAVSSATRAQEGDWALQELARLRVDVSVVCPAGISFEHGLGQPTPAAAAVSRAEVSCGQNVIVLAEATVVGRPAFVQFATWKEIDTMMLAGRVEPAVLRPFHDHGVPVVCVTAAETSDRDGAATVSGDPGSRSA